MATKYGMGGGYGDRLIRNAKKRQPNRPGGGSGGGMTAEEWARRQAEKFIQAQVDAVEQQRQIYLDELKRQAELRVQQGLRLAEALKAMGFDQRVQSLYGMAAGDIAGYAQGFSGEMRNIANADAAQAANMLSGTGQEGAVRNEGEGMGNVMYGAFGYNPAHAMRESGAAYAADAAMQPAFAAQIAAYEANQMQEKGLEGLPDFAMEIAKIKGQQPQLIQEFLDRKRGLADEAYNRKRQQILDERDWWKTQQGIYLAAGRLDLAQQAAARAQRAQDRLNALDQGRTVGGGVAVGYHTDPKSGKVVKDGWHHVMKNGTWVPVKDKSPSSKKDNKVDWGQLQEDISMDASKMYDTVGGGSVLEPTRRVQWSYEKAFKVLFTRFKGKVKDVARLRRIIRDVLEANGFKREEIRKGGN